MVLSLKEIIEYNNEDKVSFKEALSSFSCKKDLQVQNFIQNKAITFEKDKQASTFLLFNDNSDHLQLDGFFSLAIKVFVFREEISKNKRQKISGKREDHVPAFLIGQLARNDSSSKGLGKELLETAISYIKNAQLYVGGCLVYLDCKDELVSYYENYGFENIQKSIKDPDLNQMYIVI